MNRTNNLNPVNMIKWAPQLNIIILDDILFIKLLQSQVCESITVYVPKCRSFSLMSAWTLYKGRKDKMPDILKPSDNAFWPGKLLTKEGNHFLIPHQMTYNVLKTFNLFVDDQSCTWITQHLSKLDLLTRTISKHVTKLKVCYDYSNCAELSITYI